MQLIFLGKSTQGGGSPTLYATDRETYVVQGWKVDGRSAAFVEIPESLLGYLTSGIRLEAPLYSTGKRWHGDDGNCGTYILSGEPVADPDALAQMSVPDHETCIEVAGLREES